MTLLRQCQSQNGTVGYVSCCTLKAQKILFKNECVRQCSYLICPHYLLSGSLKVILYLDKLPRDTDI